MARRAGRNVGVMGETGGRTGEADGDLPGEFDEERCICVGCWDCGEVSTVRPGMVVLLLLEEEEE